MAVVAQRHLRRRQGGGVWGKRSIALKIYKDFKDHIIGIHERLHCNTETAEGIAYSIKESVHVN